MEDEVKLAGILRRGLPAHGLSVDVAHGGRVVLTLPAARAPDDNPG